MRRLPPLTSMKAFEAAARHGSFTRAAGELNVTQAAISHQVKQLEDWLDVDLFERRGHALALTPEAKAYLPDLTAALDRIAMATERITSSRKAGPLRITVLPSFATKWLMPRLGRFFSAHPGIDLHVSTSAQAWDFSQDRYEIGIRSGLGRWPGLRADLIAREAVSPVCSPALLADPSRPLRTPSDLRAHVLLHDRPADTWRRWLDMVGAGDVDAAAGVSFSESNLVLQAAIEGHGVGMGRLFLASDDLAAGRLARPFPQALPNDYSYWLVYPKAFEEKPRVAAFRSWLLAEAADCAKAVAGPQENAM